MNLISKYNSLYRKKYCSLGFVKKKSTYMRVKGDVIQSFTFNVSKCYCYSRCSVAFAVNPLCLPQPVYFDAGHYKLDCFVPKLHEKSMPWTFDGSSDDSITNCIESISQTIDLYLLPFFERCVDCKTSLAELIKLEEIFDNNRKEILRLLGTSDSALPWQERSLFDYKKYYMAIKARNLCYAQQFLDNQVNFYKTRLKSLDKPDAPRQPETVRKGFETQLAWYSEHLERLAAGDLIYFDDLLKSNENQMLEYLAEECPKILTIGGHGDGSLVPFFRSH